VEVAPARFPGWIASFAARHGRREGAPQEGAPEEEAAAPGARGGEAAALDVAVAAGRAAVTFTAPDGTIAEAHPPFPPLPREGAPDGQPHGDGGDSDATDDEAARWAASIAAHALAERTVGVLLVRLGGYAAGVFTGSPPSLAVSKTGSRLVHGRSAAGGWSQHRFARRREKQAAEALHAAADAAVQVFGRGPGALDAVVLGGDRRTVAPLRADPRLAPYLAVATDRFLTVPDPKLAVLKDTPRLFLAIRVRLTEPVGADPANPAGGEA